MDESSNGITLSRSAVVFDHEGPTRGRTHGCFRCSTAAGRLICCIIELRCCITAIRVRARNVKHTVADGDLLVFRAVDLL